MSRQRERTEILRPLTAEERPLGQGAHSQDGHNSTLGTRAQERYHPTSRLSGELKRREAPLRAEGKRPAIPRPTSPTGREVPERHAMMNSNTVSCKP